MYLAAFSDDVQPLTYSRRLTESFDRMQDPHPLTVPRSAAAVETPCVPFSCAESLTR